MDEYSHAGEPDARRRIPSTDALLRLPPFTEAAERLGRTLVKNKIVAAQQRARLGEIGAGEVAQVALAALPGAATALQAVVNATGIIIHTNLGRAELSEAARRALVVAAGATDVEFDLVSGQRAKRGGSVIEALAAAVPDAEAVHVVNNNAAALLLCALTLAAGGGEIIISRGELVEIGDGFRIPDLLTASGARLHEVGTTNRCSLNDYRAAINDRTAFILKVHPSNFLITGFTSSVAVTELATLGPPVVADIGSGLLAPHPLLPDEPDAATMLRSGAALVTASGDKLLGGPQAGLLLGRADLVQRLRRAPVARALRVDKLTLAALEATLTGPLTPTRARLEESLERLRERAGELAQRLTARGVDARAVESVAAVGGGAAPGVAIPSAAVSVPGEMAEVLRRGQPPVVGRVEDGRCLLDLRSVAPGEDELLAAAVLRAAGSAG